LAESRIDLIVRAELQKLDEKLGNHQELASGVPPARLHLVTDAPGARQFISTRAIRATPSKFGTGARARRYAIGLVRTFLHSRIAAGRTERSLELCIALSESLNFNAPSADCFIAHLFEQPFPQGLDSPMSYSFGLHARSLPLAGSTGSVSSTTAIVIDRAIYDSQRQSAMLAVLHDACEACYEDLFDRTGSADHDTVLTLCTGMLRKHVFDLLPRFRPPHESNQAAWIVSLLDCQNSELRTNDGVRFELVNELFTPCLDIPISSPGTPVTKSPIAEVFIHPSLQQPAAKEGLVAFLSANRMFSLRVRHGDPTSE
jgi:hypothetical protein